MAETLIRHLVYGFIVFTLFIIGGVGIISNLASTDSSFVDQDRFDSFNRTFNRYNELGDEIDSLQSDITGTTPEGGEDTNWFEEQFGFINSLISTLWNSVKLIFTGLGFMINAVTGLTTVFGFPSWIDSIIGMAISSVMIFVIISLVFQKDA